MNTDNLDRLIDAVEKHERFEMDKFMHLDGTPACMAGLALHLNGVIDLKAFAISHGGRMSNEAIGNLAEFLDIPSRKASQMAYAETIPGEGWIDFLKEAKPRCLAMLRRFKATQTVDFSP